MFLYGFILALSLVGLSYLTLFVTKNIIFFEYALGSKVYCIGSDHIIYFCEAVGCGYHEDDHEFYFHFDICDYSIDGWSYTYDELSKYVFKTHKAAEKALEKIKRKEGSSNE